MIGKEGLVRKTAAVKCCLLMTPSTHTVCISDHKHIHKWDALTLSETHVHAGEEQEEEQGLELHGQFWFLCRLKEKRVQSKLNKTELFRQKLHPISSVPVWLGKNSS